MKNSYALKLNFLDWNTHMHTYIHSTYVFFMHLFSDTFSLINKSHFISDYNIVLLYFANTVSEFAQELGAAMETHSANVRRLVDEFRSRSGGESRVDAGGMRRVWENLLRQVEADAASHLDLAAVLQQQLSRPTLEASFHRKLQSRKVSSAAPREREWGRGIISFASKGKFAINIIWGSILIVWIIYCNYCRPICISFKISMSVGKISFLNSSLQEILCG